MKNKETINICNSLLAGEKSAIEAYDIVIEKFSDLPQTTELLRIKGEHVDSAMQLETSIKEMGGEPKSDSGVWGTLVKGIQHTANLFGAESALTILHKGEEHGKEEYQNALNNETVCSQCKETIEEDLLPRVIHHQKTLERLEANVD